MQENTDKTDNSVLGVHKNFTLKRITSLMQEKTLSLKHLTATLITAMTAGGAVFVLAHDSMYETFFANQTEANSRIQEFIPRRDYDFHDEASPVNQFSRLVVSGNKDQAEAVLPKFLSHLRKHPNTPTKIMGFRIIAMHLGDGGRYRDILSTGARLFSDEIISTDKDVSRIFAICHIKLKNYIRAVELLKRATDSGKVYQGVPTLLLLAQASHLSGDFRSSNIWLEKGMEYKHVQTFKYLARSYYLLYAKNSSLLSDTKKAAIAKNELSDKDFAGVLAYMPDQQKIPYVYPLKNFVDGIRIEGFDNQAFPLTTASISSLDFETQKALSATIETTEVEHLEAARDLLHSETRHQTGTPSTARYAALLEHILLIDIQLGQRLAAENTSREILRIGGASRPIKARAL